jgi:hypothetical protein
MRVADIRTSFGAGSCRITASVSCLSWARPFELWFEVPSDWGASLDDQGGDLWLAALLLPAMRMPEPFEIDAPLSSELHEALPDLQAVYASWIPAAAPVEVRAERRTGPAPAGSGAGLFFSCGVDSWYSLLKAQERKRRALPSVSHLVVVHGVDVDVGRGKADVARELVDNARRAADGHGLGLLPVATNLRQLYTRVALSWHWGQAGALAAIGLALRPAFADVVVAAGPTNASVILHPEIEAGGCHPLLLPMFSTAGCEFTVDGGEVSRLRKVAAVADSPLALDTLRVCWASHEPGYNCGRCAKCVRTMLELELTGALRRCSTLPHVFDPRVVSRIRILFPHEILILRERYRGLAALDGDDVVLKALEEAIARAEADIAASERALELIRARVLPEERFLLADADELRFELARTHPNVLPFTEHDGLFNGFPRDGAAAVEELERVRRDGVGTLVVWKGCFWMLDHYRELAAHLAARYTLVSSGSEIIVFDLSTAPRASADPSHLSASAS